MLFLLCCCTNHKTVDNVNKDLLTVDVIDSIFCYNKEKKKRIIVNDSIILNAIGNRIKKSIAHRRDYFVKVPAYYGTITLFTNGDSVTYDIFGHLLTQDEEVYYSCTINFNVLLDSLVFKRDSIY